MIEINYIEDQNIVYVVTKGQFDINDVKQFLKDSAQLAHEKGCHKVLLDHRDSPFIANIFEVYSVARNLQSFGFDIDLRGAVIYNRDQEKYVFADTISTNWSFGILRFFNSIDRGNDWLNKWYPDY